jgi:hypothetical protein
MVAVQSCTTRVYAWESHCSRHGTLLLAGRRPPPRNQHSQCHSLIRDQTSTRTVAILAGDSTALRATPIPCRTAGPSEKQAGQTKTTSAPRSPTPNGSNKPRRARVPPSSIGSIRRTRGQENVGASLPFNGDLRRGTSGPDRSAERPEQSRERGSQREQRAGPGPVPLARSARPAGSFCRVRQCQPLRAARRQSSLASDDGMNE